MANCDNLKIAKFNFTELWDRTQIVYNKCPTSGRLSTLGPIGLPAPQYQSLTYKACVDLATDGYGTYGKFDIWARLSQWKFPLFQLIAVFPRPSLNSRVELFVVTHLLGDPIDTMTNLLLKLTDCQQTALHWKRSVAARRAPVVDDGNHVSPRTRLWKALTIVTDAYDEWSMGPRAKRILRDLEARFSETGRVEGFRRLIFETAEDLAADKVTKILPTVVALILFILTIAIAFIKTRSAVGGSGLNTSTFIGVEAHSIAFSALYFWIIPTVFLGSVIGTSQTERAIPRILNRFHSSLSRCFDDDQVKRLSMELTTCLRGATGSDERVYTGGIYTWRRQEIALPQQDSEPSSPIDQEIQPQDGTTSTEATLLSSTTSAIVQPIFPSRERSLGYRFVSYGLPYLILGIALTSGATVSARVPPDGFDCRVAFEITIAFFWILSAWANPFIRVLVPPTAENRKRLLRATFIKDVIAIIATLGSVYATVVGVLNRCYCWTKFGTIELVLPQRSDINILLQERLKLDFPALIFSGIAVELILMPALIWVCYPDALSVFVQKDSDESNFAWWSTIKRRVASTFDSGTKMVKQLFGRKKRRVMTNNPWGQPEQTELDENVPAQS